MLPTCSERSAHGQFRVPRLTELRVDPLQGLANVRELHPPIVHTSRPAVYSGSNSSRLIAMCT